MRMLVGLIPPDDGEVLFKGKSIRKWKSALFEHVGCLIDTPSYYPNLSAYENLAYIQKMVGKPLKEIDRVLHVTGIFKARDKKVKHFSLGMKQRLGLAMALLNDPEVLILDEPTNGLDPEGIHEIRYLLIDLCRQEGKTVFVSSHNLAEMEMMADHIALIDKGRLIYEGALGTLLMTEQYVLRVRQGEKAEQLLEADPQAARLLLAEARETSAKALHELRDLVRGIHPPVLADRGLVDAVRALALDSPLSVEVEAAYSGRLPLPIESAAYFAVSELLSNATKHAEARRVTVALHHSGDRLRITVTDDGRGGADLNEGTGLRGIARRLATFDGTLSLSSPQGGPTTATMEVPCELSSPKISSS